MPLEIDQSICRVLTASGPVVEFRTICTRGVVVFRPRHAARGLGVDTRSHRRIVIRNVRVFVRRLRANDFCRRSVCSQSNSLFIKHMMRLARRYCLCVCAQPSRCRWLQWSPRPWHPHQSLNIVLRSRIDVHRDETDDPMSRHVELLNARRIGRMITSSGIPAP